MIVKLNRVGILNVNGVFINSGANMLNEEQTQKFLAFHNNDSLKEARDSGELEYEVQEELGEVAGAVKTPGKAGDPKSVAPVKEVPDKHLSKMKTKEAVELVKLTIDPVLLEKWKKEEKRKPVEKAIDEQLKALAAPAVHRSDVGDQPDADKDLKGDESDHDEE